MGNLANVYMSEGKYAWAELLFAQTVEVQKRALGPESSDAAQTTYFMARLEARRGDKDKAVALLSNAVNHGLPPSVDAGIEKDTDLASLHNDPGFTALIAHANNWLRRNQLRRFRSASNPRRQKPTFAGMPQFMVVSRLPEDAEVCTWIASCEPGTFGRGIGLPHFIHVAKRI
jgi:hypothetical protein